MRTIDRLIAQNVAVLRQASELLERIDLAAYCGAGWVPAASGPGGHVRHCLDFYDRFLDGVRSGWIDYTARERDEATARDPEWALARIDRTVDALERIDAAASAGALLVRAEGAGSPGDAASWSHSSLERELYSLLSHTIHHFALVALVLRLQGIEPGAEFGVAPSTLEHWRRAPAGAL